MKNEKGWTFYRSHPMNEFCNGYWQKKLLDNTAGEVYAEILCYDPMPQYNMPYSYELEMQLPEALSTLGKTMNIKVLHYKDLDFVKIEEDAQKIISALIKVK